MVNNNLQGQGVGSNIITKCLQALTRFGYVKVWLEYVKGNPQPKAFWVKNQFKPTGIESIQEHYTVIAMEKELWPTCYYEHYGLFGNSYKRLKVV